MAERILTQGNFAKEVNVAFSTVSRWESRKAKPSLSAIKNVRTFCEKNGTDYFPVEEAWLDYTVEVKQ